MRTYVNAKAMAKSLRSRLSENSIELSHSQCLEIVASQFGYNDWNELAARIERAKGEGGVRLRPATPVLRIFSREKAEAFYQGYLGFQVDWRDPDDPASDKPLYMALSRGKLTVHLSEHHGDGTPGCVSWVGVKGLDAFHAELLSRPYASMRPGIEVIPPRLRVMAVIDPFGNTLRFGELAARSKI